MHNGGRVGITDRSHQRSGRGPGCDGAGLRSDLSTGFSLVGFPKPPEAEWIFDAAADPRAIVRGPDPKSRTGRSATR